MACGTSNGFERGQSGENALPRLTTPAPTQKAPEGSDSHPACEAPLLTPEGASASNRAASSGGLVLIGRNFSTVATAFQASVDAESVAVSLSKTSPMHPRFYATSANLTTHKMRPARASRNTHHEKGPERVQRVVAAGRIGVTRRRMVDVADRERDRIPDSTNRSAMTAARSVATTGKDLPPESAASPKRRCIAVGGRPALFPSHRNPMRCGSPTAGAARKEHTPAFGKSPRPASDGDGPGLVFPSQCQALPSPCPMSAAPSEPRPSCGMVVTGSLSPRSTGDGQAAWTPARMLVPKDPAHVPVAARSLPDSSPLGTCSTFRRSA